MNSRVSCTWMQSCKMTLHSILRHYSEMYFAFLPSFSAEAKIQIKKNFAGTKLNVLRRILTGQCKVLFFITNVQLMSLHYNLPSKSLFSLLYTLLSSVKRYLSHLPKCWNMPVQATMRCQWLHLDWLQIIERLVQLLSVPKAVKVWKICAEIWSHI